MQRTLSPLRHFARPLLMSMMLVTLLAVLGLAALGLHAPQQVAAQACSDEAVLVEQTLTPGDVVSPESNLSVTWTLLNSGDCTWSRSYRLIFIDGERFDGSRTVRLRSAVAPGQELVLTLDLIAPPLTEESTSELFSGTWRLRNADGENFGPDLTVALQVASAQAAEGTLAAANPEGGSDVVLPEVLVFGGMGAGDDPEAIIYCAVDGELPDAPTLTVDEETLQYYYATLLICSLPEGTEVLVEVTDPEGNVFRHADVEDAPVSGTDEEGNEYTGTVLQAHLTWLKQSPAGRWHIRVSGDLPLRQDFVAEITLELPPPLAWEGEPYAAIDNYPTVPIDPFVASRGCHYAYLPGQEMVITGNSFPPNQTLSMGIYHDRFSLGYLVDTIKVTTGDEGSFTFTFQALAEAGMYHLVIVQEVLAEGFTSEGAGYDPSVGGETAYSCFTVELAEEPEVPLRLAFVDGETGRSTIQVYDLVAGEGAYPTFHTGECDTSDPAWWPDGEWLVYQSNCVQSQSEEGWIVWDKVDDYDLYAHLIDLTYSTPDEEGIIRLTETPDWHETEADVNQDGQIVYRSSPLGESLDVVGELRVRDVAEESDRSLGIWGRAPVWSPDGSRIAFMSDTDMSGTDMSGTGSGAEGSWQIYLYDVEDDEVTLVSRGCESHCMWPAWSPNGRQILYQMALSREEFTSAGLWIASRTGLSKPRLFLAGDYAHPAWSETGWIAFQAPDGIYRTTAERIAEQAAQGTTESTTESEAVLDGYLLNPEWGVYTSPAWSH